jgi:hypothetical protein
MRKKEGFNAEKERKFLNRIYIYISSDYIFVNSLLSRLFTAKSLSSGDMDR